MFERRLKSNKVQNKKLKSGLTYMLWLPMTTMKIYHKTLSTNLI